MLSNDQDRILTDVMPGSAMHQAMSRYWIPAALSRDLAQVDSDPLAVTIMGKKLVVFRDSNGVVGVLDEHCCHRGASLCLARVEQGGIRCIYHGWKFAVDGSLLDMPNVSNEAAKRRIRQGAYPVFEAGGIVWTYLGPADKKPPTPDLAMFHVPEDHRFVEAVTCSANYTRLIEGVIDSSHVGLLHADSIAAAASGTGPEQVLGSSARKKVFGTQIVEDLAPRMEVEETDFGLRYAAIRNIRNADGERHSMARIYAFAYPACVFTPPDNLMLFAVPVHNDRTTFYMIFWDPDRAVGTGDALENLRAYYGIDDHGMDKCGLDLRTHDLPDRPRPENNFLQDRVRMRSGETFSGMHRFIPEDFAVATSMGPIAERPKEHLMPADLAVARYRSLLVKNALAIRDGETPRGLSPTVRASAGGHVYGENGDWREVFESSNVSDPIISQCGGDVPAA